jgi:hypothetical protein
MAIRGKWNHEENTAAEFQLRDTARRRNRPPFLQQQADPIVSSLPPNGYESNEFGWSLAFDQLWQIQNT